MAGQVLLGPAGGAAAAAAACAACVKAGATTVAGGSAAAAAAAASTPWGAAASLILSAQMACNVLVTACPCALGLATPTAGVECETEICYTKFSLLKILNFFFFFASCLSIQCWLICPVHSFPHLQCWLALLPEPAEDC